MHTTGPDAERGAFSEELRSRPSGRKYRNAATREGPPHTGSPSTGPRSAPPRPCACGQPCLLPGEPWLGPEAPLGPAWPHAPPHPLAESPKWSATARSFSPVEPCHCCHQEDENLQAASPQAPLISRAHSRAPDGCAESQCARAASSSGACRHVGLLSIVLGQFYLINKNRSKITFGRRHVFKRRRRSERTGKSNA